MSKVAKKLSFENSVVITNRVSVDLPRIEAALKALAIKTNSVDAARLAGLLSQVVTNWANVEALIVSEKAIEFREAELEEMRQKQAAKQGKAVKPTESSNTDFDL